MSKHLLASAFALVLGTAAVWAQEPLPAGTYKMDPTHASLTWKVNHLGLSNYTARFTKFDATLVIDPIKPEGAKLAVTVDPISIRTDFPFPEKIDFDKELGQGEKFLNAGKFPSITFKSRKVERSGDTTAKVTGDLTLLGVTKPVVLDVKLIGAKSHPVTKQPMLGFSAVGTIKRSEFGFSHLIPMVGDDVTLQVEAEFSKS